MAFPIAATLTPTTAPAVGTVSTPHTDRLLVVDVVAHLKDYLGTDANNIANRTILRAIQAAYRELTNARRWTYLYQRGRIQLNEPYDTGTVAFDATGGTYERQLTLSGGTWPTWAQYGTIRIGNVIYDVQRRISNTVLQLDETLTSADDIAAGTSYTLYQDSYLLPEDFVGADHFYPESTWGGMQYVPPSQWVAATQYYYSSASTPRWYTFRGSVNVPGRLEISVFPFPDADRTLDFVYHRRPREISLVSYDDGTVTVDTDTTPTVITGSGTTWTSSMVGSVIRLSSNATTAPTEFAGSNPAVVERNIVVFSSATSITVDDEIDSDYNGVAYLISDPIDIERGSMEEAFFRCCEKHLAITRRLKDTPFAMQLYTDALVKAEEADSRSFQGRVVGESYPARLRLADMPRGDDVE